MWKENLIALKEESGYTIKQIADGVHISESTVNRVFSKAKEDYKRGHSMDVIVAIIRFLGGSVGKVFEDTGAIIGGRNYMEMEAKIISLKEENEALKSSLNTANLSVATYQGEVIDLTKEIEFLKLQIAYKDEIIALHKQIEQSKHD